jgi:exosortase/archaeosortase family protein
MGSLLQRRRVIAQIALLLGAVIAAYHYSLLTLIRGLSLESPLAYLGLVPFIALLLAAARGITMQDRVEIRDRYVDYIVGVPFLMTALGIAVVLPIHASNVFWLWRLDLLSLPLFVAGSVAVIFGVHALWRLKVPIAFLFLAWPVPYVRVLNDYLQVFTNATISGLDRALHYVHVAAPAPGSDGSLFAIGQSGRTFLVSVASACAGVNGMVGFLLVGAAFAVLVRGRILSKLAWLAVGMALVWGFNLVRLLIIFAVGDRWGERVAIDALHPFIGLVTFTLAVLAMVLLLPVFRLHIGGNWISAPLRVRAPGSRTRRRAAGTVVIAAAAVGALANASLPQFELLAQDLGTPRLQSFSAAQAAVTGWRVQQTDVYPWVSRYFGPDATWTRYAYAPGAGGGLQTTSREPVVLDVISTSDLGTFATYGLEACYHFHNYRTLDEHRVDLGGGVTAHSVAYYNPAQRIEWLAVYWEWPVRSARGQRYERLILSTTVAASATDSPANPSLVRAVGLLISDWIGPSKSSRPDPRLVDSRSFLVTFGQKLVDGLAAHAQTASTTDRSS